jgi:hypothetical protein
MAAEELSNQEEAAGREDSSDSFAYDYGGSRTIGVVLHR